MTFVQRSLTVLHKTAVLGLFSATCYGAFVVVAGARDFNHYRKSTAAAQFAEQQAAASTTADNAATAAAGSTSTATPAR
jgi:hypothetical protein